MGPDSFPFLFSPSPPSHRRSPPFLRMDKFQLVFSFFSETSQLPCESLVFVWT